MKYYLFAPALAIVVIACQQKPQPADPGAAKSAAAATADAYHKALKAKSVDGIAQLIAEDALFCGSDPSEIWTKSVFIDYAKGVLSDSTVGFGDYAIDRRDVRVSADGMSAIVQDQALIGPFSKRVPVRVVFNIAKKSDDKWLIDYCSVGMIPTNKDLSRLDAALEGAK